jgi:hypothetical protein
MMVLDICNSSTDHDIEAAMASFKDLGLSFTTEALWLIKTMQGSWAYSLTVSTAKTQHCKPPLD